MTRQVTNAAPRAVSLWAPVVAYMTAIFIVSAMSQPPNPVRVSDKAQHFAAYAGLGLVTLRATSRGRRQELTGAAALAAWGIAALYGVSDEIHQSFVPGRSPEAADAVADALGAGAAIAAAFGIIRGSRRVARRD